MQCELSFRPTCNESAQCSQQQAGMPTHQACLVVGGLHAFCCLCSVFACTFQLQCTHSCWEMQYLQAGLKTEPTAAFHVWAVC